MRFQRDGSVVTSASSGPGSTVEVAELVSEVGELSVWLVEACQAQNTNHQPPVRQKKCKLVLRLTILASSKAIRRLVLLESSEPGGTFDVSLLLHPGERVLLELVDLRLRAVRSGGDADLGQVDWLAVAHPAKSDVITSVRRLSSSSIQDTRT